MTNSLTLLTIAVCAAISIRLMTFRREGARYRFGVSLLAYIMAASTGCQALGGLLGLYHVESPFILSALIILCVLVYRARGNVASMLRMT